MLTEPSNQPARDAAAAVFISYAREDADAAERLRLALAENGFSPHLDKHEILPGEAWRERLGRLISAADTVVFLISSDAVDSETCDWEVNEAERLSKRILPVVIRDVSDDKVPGRLKRLNYLFMRNESEWISDVPKLVEAILADIGWIREHSRLAELAIEWTNRDRPDDLMLRGDTLNRAETWLTDHPAKAPEPASLHREFIHASRLADFQRAANKQAEISNFLRRQATISHALTVLSILLTYLSIAAIGIEYPDLMSLLITTLEPVHGWFVSLLSPRYGIWIRLLLDTQSLLFFVALIIIRASMTVAWSIYDLISSHPARRPDLAGRKSSTSFSVL